MFTNCGNDNEEISCFGKLAISLLAYMDMQSFVYNFASIYLDQDDWLYV